ncbi:MAG: ADP-ribosylglycohydrolase family protein [Desulfurococcales archaeon]|nr:ADP-ribosylglycohydrolase family protein [Desulfurococcales archaeon]
MNVNTLELKSRILGAVYGAVLGDVIGVPFEFLPPEKIRIPTPLKELPGGGPHGQEPGVWSDDSSLLLATADALAKQGLSLEAAAEAFLKWYTRGEYTSKGIVFDIGFTTQTALQRLLRGARPEMAGVERPSCGSLMRILPVSLYTACDPLEEAVEWAHRYSRITHSHPEAEMACGLYTAIIHLLLRGESKQRAIRGAGRLLDSYYARLDRYKSRVGVFQYLKRPDSLVGREYWFNHEWEACYAPKTLEASVWAFLNGGDVLETIILAITRGYDTDTVATVAGGLAGAYYGLNRIPHRLLQQVKGYTLLTRTAQELAEAVLNRCGDAI